MDKHTFIKAYPGRYTPKDTPKDILLEREGERETGRKYDGGEL